MPRFWLLAKIQLLTATRSAWILASPVPRLKMSVSSALRFHLINCVPSTRLWCLLKFSFSMLISYLALRRSHSRHAELDILEFWFASPCYLRALLISLCAALVWGVLDVHERRVCSWERWWWAIQIHSRSCWSCYLSYEEMRSCACKISWRATDYRQSITSYTGCVSFE